MKVGCEVKSFVDLNLNNDSQIYHCTVAHCL